jgi:Rrf2 family protein
MRISSKVDYAVRAVAELASEPGVAVPATRISDAQAIPLNFLEHILEELQQGGIVRADPEKGGGFEFVGDPAEVTIADIAEAVEGPLAAVRGEPPEDFTYPGAARALPRVWVAVRENLGRVLEHVTIADVASGKLPASIDGVAAGV